MAQPKIRIICKRLWCMKGPVLLSQSCRISVTEDNRRTGRSPNEDPILKMSHKLEVLNHTNYSLQWTFVNEDVWTEGSCGTHCYILQPPQWDVFYVVVCVLFEGRSSKGKGQIRGDREISGTGVHDVWEKQLAQPPTGCSTWENRPCAMTGQHSGDGFRSVCETAWCGWAGPASCWWKHWVVSIGYMMWNSRRIKIFEKFSDMALCGYVCKYFKNIL